MRQLGEGLVAHEAERVKERASLGVRRCSKSVRLTYMYVRIVISFPFVPTVRLSGWTLRRRPS